MPDRSALARGALWITRKLGKWVLISVIGALVVPALTKQWSDRQKELELKRDLASDIGSSSFSAFAAARTIAYLPREKRTAERRLLLLSDWISNEGRIDGIFRAYLYPKSKHEVTVEWSSFRDGLYDYLRLACCEKYRSGVIRRVQRYLERQGLTEALPPNRQWSMLACGPGCDGYADAYDWLGRQVLLGAPYRGIEASDPTGFSNGFRDFVHDVVPGY